MTPAALSGLAPSRTRTEPILALAELTSLGATNPASIDPLVSPFPFAGLDTSITRPCCDTVA